jgi:hypothetical protein
LEGESELFVLGFLNYGLKILKVEQTHLCMLQSYVHF